MRLQLSQGTCQRVTASALHKEPGQCQPRCTASADSHLLGCSARPSQLTTSMASVTLPACSTAGRACGRCPQTRGDGQTGPPWRWALLPWGLRLGQTPILPVTWHHRRGPSLSCWCRSGLLGGVCCVRPSLLCANESAVRVLSLPRAAACSKGTMGWLGATSMRWRRHSVQRSG